MNENASDRLSDLVRQLRGIRKEAEEYGTSPSSRDRILASGLDRLFTEIDELYPVQRGSREFLNDVITIAIENYGYGWFKVGAYHWEDIPETWAVIESPELPGGLPFKVTPALMQHGIDVILGSRPNDNGRMVTEDDSPLGLSAEQVSYLRLAVEDDDAGEVDVILALAILECGIFGRVVFA